ncbi:hypothetical protein CANARDRAFT_29779 [[Candida] arabinofermentans NRRL YB-2248]|uniref:Uncharacterized protein n=1 Tax=[Candida] arabinofermentans NRRL YB-2248 TaxID=983967 RepID=A0A1E4SWD2_9ASCO|nr:hypothetical protein CANARDRAFT_30611 [[Candida] arabinofermentans NRRL YB-2248]ODV83808.1 hypothetical protein CANARDRAFT_29779 [[Candida] arabinofermentans NRRL YB-2248]
MADNIFDISVTDSLDKEVYQRDTIEIAGLELYCDLILNTSTMNLKVEYIDKLKNRDVNVLVNKYHYSLNDIEEMDYNEFKSKVNKFMKNQVDEEK